MREDVVGMELFIDHKNYDADSEDKSTRVTSRAIIKRGETYLFVFNKYGEYHLPGGGVEPDEELTEALIREIEEETGYLIEKDSIQKWIHVIERRKGRITEIFNMESHYFFCDVKDEMGIRELDEFEIEEEYQTVWVTLEEAMKKNIELLKTDRGPLMVRDIKIMKLLLGQSDAPTSPS